MDDAPTSVTLIQPTAVDTMYDEHSRNYQPNDAKLPSPMVSPEQVAEAILSAAVEPQRAIKVGVMSKLNTFLQAHLPGVADKVLGKMDDGQERDTSDGDHAGTLHKPGETIESGRVHGHHAKA